MKVYGNVGTGEHGDTRPAVAREFVAGDGQLRDLPMRYLDHDPVNARSDVNDVAELAASMTAVGLIQPVVVHPQPGEPGRWWVVAGNRRLAAARLLGWDTIQAITRPPLAEDERLAIILVENGQRAALNPIEEARALRLMRNGSPGRPGLSMKQIGQRTGRSTPWIVGRLHLLNLSPEDQEAVASGRMSKVAGERKARVLGGRPKGQQKRKPPGWHFTYDHPLVERAETRCKTNGHLRSRHVGGTAACGGCWESVIRVSERERINAAVREGEACPTCGHEVDALSPVVASRIASPRGAAS